MSNYKDNEGIFVLQQVSVNDVVNPLELRDAFNVARDENPRALVLGVFVHFQNIGSFVTVFGTRDGYLSIETAREVVRASLGCMYDEVEGDGDGLEFCSGQTVENEVNPVGPDTSMWEVESMTLRVPPKLDQWKTVTWGFDAIEETS